MEPSADVVQEDDALQAPGPDKTLCYDATEAPDTADINPDPQSAGSDKTLCYDATEAPDTDDENPDPQSAGSDKTLCYDTSETPDTSTDAPRLPQDDGSDKTLRYEGLIRCKRATRHRICCVAGQKGGGWLDGVPP